MSDPRCPHCDTSVDEHEAGHCLDGWVALSVMDLEMKMYPGVLNPHYYPDDDWNKDYSGDARHTLPIPEYSIDIAAAWEVVGVLQKEGWWMDLTYSPFD